MKMNSMLVSILGIALCCYSVSSYPADDDEDPSADDPKLALPPAQILTVPRDIVASRDESVTLQCEVENPDPDSALVWKKDNHEAIYVDDKCFAGQHCLLYNNDFKNKSSALTIGRVNETTAGNYFCTYRSASIMHRVYLKVTVDAVSGPKSIEFGQTLNLACRVSGYPAPEVTWHFQANETARNVALGQGLNLVVEHVTSANSGIYTCTALGHGNEPPASRRIAVAVVKGIAALDPIVNAGNSSSGTVTLCCIHGHTKEDGYVKWSKYGKEIMSDGRRSIEKTLKTRSCMMIMTVKEEDLGTYTCQLAKATTTDSKAPTFAQIELTGIPLTPTLLEVTSDSAKTPVLKWSVKSFSPLTSYQVRVKKQEQTENDWLVQTSKPLSSTNQEQIIEQSLDSISNGVYDVELVVTNKFGSARLVSNNRVAVDRSEQPEVLAEKIKNSDGNGASRSIAISFFCIISGVLLSQL